jgi:hypothetical protein
MTQHTVNSNGNCLAQGIAILAEESRDLSKLAGLQVLDARLGSIGLDNVELDIVGIRSRENGGGAGVVLEGQRY